MTEQANPDKPLPKVLTQWTTGIPETHTRIFRARLNAREISRAMDALLDSPGEALDALAFCIAHELYRHDASLETTTGTITMIHSMVQYLKDCKEPK